MSVITPQGDSARNPSHKKTDTAGLSVCDSAEAERAQKTGSHLGIYARTPASQHWRGLQTDNATFQTLEQIDENTGEIVTFEVKNKGGSYSLQRQKTPQQSRAHRYALKSVVNVMFPTSSTSKCSRWIVPGQKVKVLKDAEHSKAFYSGLIRCGSVWWCPLCAAKIAERRRVELIAATASAQMLGWQVMLMTCTVPHGIGDDVKQIKANMLTAWRKMTDCRAGKLARQQLGIIGTIRAFEVTDGQNGFHPHFHVLIFSDSGESCTSFQDRFYPLWLDACIKSGLPAPSLQHGLRVDNGEWAARYASKWGLEDEMTKGHLKTAKGQKGFTPWQMLEEVLVNRCQRSWSRFMVYANAFKGSRQLYWSNGLKSRLGVSDVTDEELVSIEEENASVLAELTADEWRVVIMKHCESAVLELAERSPELLPEFIATLHRNDKLNTVTRYEKGALCE